MINEGHHYSKVDQYMYEHGYRKISEIVKFYGVFDKILNISYIIQNYLRFPAQVFHFFPFICKNCNNVDEKCVQLICYIDFNEFVIQQSISTGLQDSLLLNFGIDTYTYVLINKIMKKKSTLKYICNKPLCFEFHQQEKFQR